MRTKKALYNVVTNLILQLIIIIYGFIVPKIIISNFGSNVNGLISSITQFLAYISLLESGFGPVVKSILYKPIASKDKKTIANILKTSEKFFRKIACIFFVYMILLAVIYPMVVNSGFDYLYTISLIIIISISTFAEYYFGMTYRLFLQAEQKTYIISLIRIITYLLSIIVIIILARLDCSIHIIKLVSGLTFVFRPILQNMYVKKKYNINLKEVSNDYKIKNKWDGLAQHIAAVIHSNTDITILTFFCKLSEVSVYSVYHLVVSGIKSLIQAFTGGLDASFGNMIANNENENLNKKFNIYEILFLSITTILCTTTLLLITPFIAVYTNGITDVNYVRYTFGYLIVISEFICMIRLPYISLAHAAGHFKETRVGAWIESLLNIVISIILVFKFGIIGVAIGTIIAMLVRTCEFVYHSNKFVLNRSVWGSIKKLLLVIIQTLIIVFICRFVPFLENENYINWIFNAFIVFVISTLVVIIIDVLFYGKELKQIINILKNIRKKVK